MIELSNVGLKYILMNSGSRLLIFSPCPYTLYIQDTAHLISNSINSYLYRALFNPLVKSFLVARIKQSSN